MNSTTSHIRQTIFIPATLNNTRLDLALSTLLPEYSRARIQEWIKAGYITVDDKILRIKDKVHTNQTIKIEATITNLIQMQPQPIALNVVYEDQDIIIINKPVGLVTHPGAGNPQNTLLNALLYHYPMLANLPRAGIIHRLDKNTSGLMIITHNLKAHHLLVDALQKRKIKREYEAIVHGKMVAGGIIKTHIGRHPLKRTHMAVKETGKLAVTHYRIIKRFAHHTHVHVNLETGRTHQIRVHLAHIGYPIVGDPNYSNITKVSEKLNLNLQKKLIAFKHQALHARRLELHHPTTNKLMAWEVNPPQDFIELLETLSQYDI